MKGRKEMFTIYDSFGFLFTKAYNQIKDRLVPFLNEIGLTEKQMGTLLIISTNEGITQRKTGHLQQVDRTSMTQIIDVLENKEYAIRKKIPNDRRAYGLFLTNKGKLLIEQIRNEIQRIQDDYFKDISPSEIEILQKILIMVTTDDSQVDD